MPSRQPVTITVPWPDPATTERGRRDEALGTRPWAIQVTWTMVGDSWIPTGVGIESTPGTGGAFGRVTATFVRGLPIATVIEASRWRLSSQLGIEDSRAMVRAWTKQEDMSAALAASRASRGDAEPQPRPGRPTDYDESHFLRVAEVYAAARRCGDRRPVQAVMQAVPDSEGRLPATHGAAKSWIQVARSRGLIVDEALGSPNDKPKGRRRR